MYTFEVKNTSSQCKHPSSKKLKSVTFWIIAKWNLSSWWDDCFSWTSAVMYIVYRIFNKNLTCIFPSVIYQGFKLAKCMYEQTGFFGGDHILMIFFDFYWQSLLKFSFSHISSFSLNNFVSFQSWRQKRKKIIGRFPYFELLQIKVFWPD